MQRPQTPTLCNASFFCNPARTSLVLGDSSNLVARYVHRVKRGSARLAGERVHSSKTLQGEEGGQGGQLHNAHCKPMQPDQQQICEYNMCGNMSRVSGAVMRGRACSGSCAEERAGGRGDAGGDARERNAERRLLAGVRASETASRKEGRRSAPCACYCQPNSQWMYAMCALVDVGHRSARGRASFEERAGSGTVGVGVERPGRKRRA